MENIAQLIANYGFSVILMAWMIYKDYKFNDNITIVLSEIKDVLTELRTWHSVEDERHDS